MVAGCEAAWSFFGGVFKVLVPDNLKPVVNQADPVNPRLSVGWLDYVQHAGFGTDPARVRRPKDKPRVERVVQYVWGNFWAGETFTDLQQAQDAASRWCARTAGMRIHGTIAARSRCSCAMRRQRCYRCPRRTTCRSSPWLRCIVTSTSRSARRSTRCLSSTSASTSTPARTVSWSTVPARGAGQDPPAPAARRPVHRSRGPARAQGRLRAAGPGPAHRGLRRARAEHRPLRRAAA